jgi:serine/threonine protein phosphatase PrpC
MKIEFSSESLANNKTLFDQNQPNEDFALHKEVADGWFFVVADGNDPGALFSGTFAEFNVSRVACEAFIESVTEVSPEKMKEVVLEACAQSVRETMARISGDVQCQQQSTTLTGLGICEGNFVCGHVGDSVLYHYREAEKEVVAITESTSPLIDPAEADNLEISPYAGLLGQGDYLLLTTAGLVNVWEDDFQTLFESLADKQTAPAQVVERMFAKAPFVNRHDDLTSFVIRCSP